MGFLLHLPADLIFMHLAYPDVAGPALALRATCRTLRDGHDTSLFTPVVEAHMRTLLHAMNIRCARVPRRFLLQHVYDVGNRTYSKPLYTCGRCGIKVPQILDTDHKCITPWEFCLHAFLGPFLAVAVATACVRRGRCFG